jgi:type IX secretion system PorP/SprF family membrane protein
MRIIFLFFLLLVGLSGLIAQQLPLLTQQREYWSYINPALISADYFNYEYNVGIGASYRRQWSNQEFGPRTAILRGEYLHNPGEGVSLISGFHFLRDALGPTGYTGAFGRIGAIISKDPYAYGSLSIGLTFGIVNFSIDGSQVNLLSSGDILDNRVFSQMAPDMGLGVAYHYRFYNEDVFYAGISLPQMFNFDLSIPTDDGEFSIGRVRHIYANLGYIKTINEGTFIEFSSWLKHVAGGTPHVDLMARYQLIPHLAIELGASTAKQLRWGFGVNIGDPGNSDRLMRLNYNNEYSLESYNGRFGVSHEVTISFLAGN